jgi:hypothetical protein
MIAFRVHGTGIEGILYIINAKEPGGQLKRLWAKPRYFLEVYAAAKRAIVISVGDNVFGQRGAKARNIGEKLLTGSIYFYTNLVYTAHDGFVEITLEPALIDIMLVLPHPDGLGVNLYQFRERIQ